jgi:hypothetical protein
MNRQRGLSLSGIIVLSIIVVLIAIGGFKLVPVYLEYNRIKTIFKSMAEDPALSKASRPELDRAWGARTMVDDVKSMDGANIEYTKDATGLHIAADYSVKVKLFANLHACIDFHPTSD